MRDFYVKLRHAVGSYESRPLRRSYGKRIASWLRNWRTNDAFNAI
ncbi:hypothetical protein PLANPX_4745 [Lacipirellula parvula]|uniref:Uncharacterized protein n=1 Tax=Lacipirellula parvula TaxID=2650471 RepID=A0A5K7XL25_9BACT|nr:hypothetical protein PLANPX_4745 [Lacipirellula parvula]